MDIHKPKPWRGWREFLKEYLIIVVGVLTALGAEAVVENLHWREKVARAEEAEKPELQAFYYNAYERALVDPCIGRRIDALEAALLADGPWVPAKPMLHESWSLPFVIQTPNRGWRDQVWRTLVADGTASHLPPARERLYADVMGFAEGIEARNGVEANENAGLNVLLKPASLSRDQRGELIARLEQERARSWLLALNSRQLMPKLEQLFTPDRKALERKLLTNSATYRACYQQGYLPPGSPAPPPQTDEARRALGAPAS